MSATYGPEPIDRSEPLAVQYRKAGEGALWDALRRAGWTDVKIHYGLATYRGLVRGEAADQLRAMHPSCGGQCEDWCDNCALSAAADLMDSRVTCTCTGWKEAIRKRAHLYSARYLRDLPEHHADCKTNKPLGAKQ